MLQRSFGFRKRLTEGADLVRKGGLRQVREKFAARGDTIGRTLLIAGCAEAIEAVVVQEAEQGCASDLLREFCELALGGAGDVEFLTGLAMAFGKREQRTVAADTMLSALAVALRQALSVAPFALRHRIIASMAVLERRAANLFEQLDATPDEFTPSIESHRESRSSNASYARAQRHFDSLHRKRLRYRLMRCAISGDAEEREALFRQIDEQQTNTDVASSLVRALPLVWRFAEIAEKSTIAAQIVPFIARGDREPLIERGRERMTEGCLVAATELLEHGFEPGLLAHFVLKMLRILPDEVHALHGQASGMAKLSVASFRAAAALAAAAPEWAEEVVDAIGSAASPPLCAWGNPGRLTGALEAAAYLGTAALPDSHRHRAWSVLTEALHFIPDCSDALASLRTLTAWQAFSSSIPRIASVLGTKVRANQICNPKWKAPSEKSLRFALATAFVCPDATYLTHLTAQEDRGDSFAFDAQTTLVPDSLLIRVAEWERALFQQAVKYAATWDQLPGGEQPWVSLLIARLLSASPLEAIATLDIHSASPSVSDVLAVTASVALASADMLAIASVALAGHPGPAMRQDEVIAVIHSLPHDADVGGENGLAAALAQELEMAASTSSVTTTRSGNRDRITSASSPGVEQPDEERGTQEESTSPAPLPDHLVALLAPHSPFHVLSEVARGFDLHRQRELLRNPKFDLALPLLQLAVRGADPLVFEAIAARMSDMDEQRLALLIGHHVAEAREHASDPDAIRWATHHIETLKRDLSELRVHPSDLLNGAADESESSDTQPRWTPSLLGTLEHFTRLTGPITNEDPTTAPRVSGTVWKAIATPASKTPCGSPGGFGMLLRHFDLFRKRLGEPLGLSETCAEAAEALAVHTQIYLDLPVGEFTAREEALSHARNATIVIEDLLERESRLHAPERTLLVALLRHWRNLFEKTLDNCVRRAKLLFDTGKSREFFATFVGPPGAGTELPAQPPGHTLRHERFFVEWMASELDIDTLRTSLQKRWPPWFRGVYSVATSLVSILALIAAPYLLVAWLARFPEDSMAWQLRAVGFALYDVTLYVVLLIILVSGAFRIFGLRNSGNLEERYLFAAFLPRLFRLIVVPMALLVDFDHSYHFPITATDPTLVILFLLTFFSTVFYVGREVVGEREPLAADASKHRRRIFEIVALALLEAHLIAILFSSLFGSNYFGHDLALLAELHPFLGFIPKIITFDTAAALHLDAIAHRLGYAIIHPWLTFTFYPTIILVWTALGLFTGVFLEGFFKGERIRGSSKS